MFAKLLVSKQQQLPKALAAIFLVGGLLVLPGQSLAIAPNPWDSITIGNKIDEFDCGTQQMIFNGTSTNNPSASSPHHAVITLDGSDIASFDFQFGTPFSWQTPAQVVSAGSHTLVANLYDGYTTEGENDAQDTWNFTIPACPTPTPTPTLTGSGGPGDEQDCCKGHDPEPSATAAPKGKVLGTTTKKVTPTPTPKVAGVTTVKKAPATGPDMLPVISFSLISGGAAYIGLNRKTRKK